MEETGWGMGDDGDENFLGALGGQRRKRERKGKCVMMR